MKKSSIKNVSLVWGAALLISGCIWIVAQSNANDETAITIDTNRYTATQHIQEVHLNDKSSSTRVWLKSEDGLVLGVGEVGVDERVGKLKNSVGGEASVIGGRNNENKGSQSSLIVGGEDNRLANGKLGSVVMGGKSNQVNSSETVVLAAKNVETVGSGAVAVAVQGGQILGENSLSFAGDSHVKNNDSMAVGLAVMMEGTWSFVFNGKGQGIMVHPSHAFIVNADHGLIVGTNKNNGTGISLTVNGAVRVGEAKGHDSEKAGAIFRVACSKPVGASCLCVNVEWQIKSMSSNPACDQVCDGTSKQCFLTAKCGTRAITYAAAETDRRANTTFCALGSHKSGLGGAPFVMPTNFPEVWETVKWYCTSDFGGGTYQCLAQRKQQPKENAKCGSYSGMSFTAASLTTWPAGWTFCQKGVPTPTTPVFPKTGRPVTWTCGGENLNSVTCSANGCNRCSKEGLPYCFPVDLDPSCNTSTPVFKCIGAGFANASLIPWDDQGLNSNLEKKLVASNTARKCEYQCNQGFTFSNGVCVKSEKRCTVKIDKVSCKNDGHGIKWRLDYTYKGDCYELDIFGTRDKYFKENIQRFATHSSAHGDSILNHSESVTARRYLTPPSSFGGPSLWYFQVDMWNNNVSPVFSIDRVRIEKDNCPSSSSSHSPVKVDWKGNPFAWEKDKLYIEKDGKPLEVGILYNIYGRYKIEGKHHCNAAPEPKDYSINKFNCVSFNFRGPLDWWIYLPYNSNQWVKIRLAHEGPTRRIDDVSYYFANLTK